MNYNLILDVDSYKASHWLQYPPQTTGMYSYLESRGGKSPATVFFGLQYILKQYLSQPVTPWMVEEAETFFSAHGVPFNAAGWHYIAHDLKGRLPLRICAVPEGTVVPVQNVLMTMESTDPQTFWIISWLETLLLRVWYPTTVATQSWQIKQQIYNYLEKTSDDPAGEIGFKLHDFGARGVSSCESAGLGGMAHLVNFCGSDTVQGVLYANHYYNHPMAAYSIPAAEHSTITAWQRQGEEQAYRNMLHQFAKPGSLVAVVSDSYDLWSAIDHLWGDRLRQAVIDSGATVVIRPDSGNPVEIVGKVLQRLDYHFGSTVNTKGYKVLQHVRVIQGDGVNEHSIGEILQAIAALGFSATNVAFGMGGALLQKLNRDTQKFAIKCSEVTVAGEAIAVYKDPITDPGKKSKAGRLALIKTPTGYQTVPATTESLQHNQLGTVYENGVIQQETTFEQVRQRAWS
ncbi:MAG: nicotinate phosphoribosyltransferase [Aphanocapsa sp. GSE-SYN-MK-11-07L]|jgi:nicotinamide phosphoribosyltransferase|nr:nicotinate phosphoribosyltransferase [Aphanocapsa sp. GSE-SYN-MK-11-07L]